MKRTAVVKRKKVVAEKYKKVLKEIECSHRMKTFCRNPNPERGPLKSKHVKCSKCSYNYKTNGSANNAGFLEHHVN